MFKTSTEAIQWITTQRNTENGFGSFRRYLDEQENHLDGLKIIHVAGTNGKGSTVAMLASCLQIAGYKVGTFTSPHLLTHEDRIRINGIPIPSSEFLRICNERKDLWMKYHLSMFEMDLDIASIWYEAQNVDYVVLEVGLGGRLDSTNVILTSLASVIVSIGFDHMDRLGDTIEAIAKEKAGIIKEHGLVICGETKNSCQQVIQNIAYQQKATFVVPNQKQILSESPILFKQDDLMIELSERALYQVHNAGCALTTLLELRKRNVIDITDEQILRGLKKAHWPGRFEAVANHPLTIVDGAHNAHAMNALKESVKVLPRPLTCVFACLKDKDKQEMLSLLQELSDTLVLTEFDFYRAMKVDDFVCDESIIKRKDWQQAIKEARTNNPSGTVLITGSLYFVSEVLDYFTKNT